MTETAAVYKTTNAPETLDVVSLGVTEADIKSAIAEADVRLIPGDKKSYDLVKKVYMKFVHFRNRIDDRRKEINRDTNNKAKRLLEMFEKPEASLKKQIDTEDARLAAIEAEKARAEQERKDRIAKRISEIKRWANYGPLDSSTEIQNRINAIRELKKDFDFQEFTDDAEILTDEIMGILSVALANCQEFERIKAAQKAEAERLEKEKAELAMQKAELEAKEARTNERDPKEEIKTEASAPIAEPETATQNEPGVGAAKAEDEISCGTAKTEKPSENGNGGDDVGQVLKSDKEKLIKWLNDIDLPMPITLIDERASAIYQRVKGNIAKLIEKAFQDAEAL